MYSRLQLAQKYLRYYLTAANGRGHGIHSPFVYDFVRNVLRDHTEYAAYGKIEELRRRLLRDETMVEVEDMGAGSAQGAGRARKISEIAKHAAKPAKLGQLLYRIARYYRPAVVVELGTSLGVSAGYLAAGARDGMPGPGAPGAGVWTIEGSPAIAEQAERNLQRLGLERVGVERGNFDVMMEPLLERIGPVGLAFVDGNHRREPTLLYFNSLLAHSGPSAILIFDDIHWSADMERAWEEIKTDVRVMMTIDLFFIGLVVIREELKIKQDFTVRF